MNETLVSEERVSDELFHSYFSPFTPHTITIDGVVYPTVEHAYHAMRYRDEKLKDEIRRVVSPEEAWEISQRYKDMQETDFPAKKRAIMKSLCKAKLMQHQDVLDALLATGDLKIVKHITSGPKADGYWDDGTQGDGQNVTGQIWMELRAELKQNTK